MTTIIHVETLTETAFAPFGRILGQPETPADAEREDMQAWVNISDLWGMEPTNPMWSFLRAKRHTLGVVKLERHVKAAKAIIPLEGSCVLLVADGDGPEVADGNPDESTIRAFLLDGSQGVFLPRGCWHWVLFSVTDEATFMLLMEQDIVNDIEEREIGDYQIAVY